MFKTNYFMNPYIIPGIIRTNRADSIIELICNYVDVTKEQVFKKNRSHRVVLARQLIYYFLKKRTPMTLKEMGILFNQDHTTVIHSINTIENYISINDVFVCDCVNGIKNTILIAA